MKPGFLVVLRPNELGGIATFTLKFLVEGRAVRCVLDQDMCGRVKTNQLLGEPQQVGKGDANSPAVEKIVFACQSSDNLRQLGA